MRSPPFGDSIARKTVIDNMEAYSMLMALPMKKGRLVWVSISI